MDTETHQAPAPPGRSATLRSRFAKGHDGPPTSVFVVGTLFSGSTLLGRDMTTRIRKAHYVGELNNFTQFPGLSHEGTGRTMCGPCSLLGKRCRHFTPELRERVSYDDIPGMHEQFARSLGASAIIDGSKYVAWLRHALEQQRASGTARPTPLVIVTVRNPVAFAISHRNRTGEALWQGAGIWRDTYVDALRTANTHGLPSLVVRYENYMAAPERSLRRLSEFLRLPLEAEPDNTGLHDTGGNWSSFVPYVGSERVEKHIDRLDEGPRERTRNFVKHAKEYWNDGKPKADTRWMGSLDSGEVNAVLSTPGLADVAGLLGYNLAEVVHLAVRPGC